MGDLPHQEQFVALTQLKKDKITSVIICESRPFKAKAVNYIHGAAYPAEKKTVDNMKDAITIINGDKFCHILVIDATNFKDEDLMDGLKKLRIKNKNEELRLLLYLDEAKLGDKETYEKLFKRTSLASFPIKQQDFNRAFHQRKPKIDPNATPKKKEKAKEPEANSSHSATSLIETSNHIKDTIDMINSLVKDRSNFELLADISQRFNGLIGAFRFFGGKEGYPLLGHLAEIIDTVGRSYEESDAKEIETEHFQLIVDAARCSYLILKDMREGRGVIPKRLKQHQDLSKAFSSLSNIKFKENFNQSEVDQLLEEQLKLSS